MTKLEVFVPPAVRAALRQGARINYKKESDFIRDLLVDGLQRRGILTREGQP